MNLEDSIILDHFFLMVNGQLFQRLKELALILRNTQVDRIERPDVTYEGIYIFAKNGTYLEFLDTTGTNYDFYLGLGLTSKNSSLNVTEKYLELYSHLDWEIHKILNKNNEPWYNAYMLSAKKACPNLDFKNWLIKYHTQKRKRDDYNFSIEKFSSMRLEVPKCFSKLIEYNIQWLPSISKISENKAVLKIPQNSDDSFTISIVFDDSLHKPNAVELKALLVDPNLNISHKLGSMSFYTNNGEIVFEFLDL